MSSPEGNGGLAADHEHDQNADDPQDLPSCAHLLYAVESHLRAFSSGSVIDGVMDN